MKLDLNVYKSEPTKIKEPLLLGSVDCVPQRSFLELAETGRNLQKLAKTGRNLFCLASI